MKKKILFITFLIAVIVLVKVIITTTIGKIDYLLLALAMFLLVINFLFPKKQINK